LEFPEEQGAFCWFSLLICEICVLGCAAGIHFETFLAPVGVNGRAKPGRAEPRRAGPRRAEPSRAEASLAAPGPAEPGPRARAREHESTRVREHESTRARSRARARARRLRKHASRLSLGAFLVNSNRNAYCYSLFYITLRLYALRVTPAETRLTVYRRHQLTL
jgi:hypothetical protein